MPFDAKAATPDTSMPAGALLFGADSQAAAEPSVYPVDTVVAAYIGKAIENAPLVLPVTTGSNMRMTHPVGMGAMTTAVIAGATNRLAFVPAHFYYDRTITEVGIHVTTLAASGVARLGLYEDAGGVPGVFVADFGEVLTSTTGYKSIAISQAVLGTKWYWWAIVAGTAAATITSMTHPISPFGCDSSVSSSHRYFMFSTHTYGALPTGNQSGASYTRTATGLPLFYWI